MSKIRVIKRKNLPARLPIFATAFCLFLLDYYKAPQWLWGAGIVVLFVIWILVIKVITIQEDIDLFEDKKNVSKDKNVNHD